MKVGYRCAVCLVNRAHNAIMRATDDREKRFEALSKTIELIGREFKPDAVPSILGVKRDRMIKSLTGNSDPYNGLKRSSTKTALAMLPEAEALVEAEPTSFERFRMACKAACVGNLIEYDLLDREVEMEELTKVMAGDEFCIDDTEGFFHLAKRERGVLYLADNAGEIAFDKLLVRELNSLGCRVTVAVKGGPALNDALLEDAVEVGIDAVAVEVLTTGTDAIGVILDESSSEFVEKFYSSHLILSKGMANWETLTEIGTPCSTLFLLRVKCEPVAESLGAPMEKNVAKLVPKGFRL